MPNERLDDAQVMQRTLKACSGCIPLEEAEHRIANHLSLLSGFVRLQANEMAKQRENPTRETMLLLFDKTRAYIEAISSLHRALAVNGPIKSSDLGEHLHHVCLPFVSGLHGSTMIEEDLLPGCHVRLEWILPISQIVAEALTNALKYVKQADGKIWIRCRSDEAGAVTVEVVDNGPGLPVGHDHHAGVGLGSRLIQKLVKQIGARIEYRSSVQGLHIELKLADQGHTPGSIA
jgi:two-component sensor histidine kinase